MIEQLPDTSSKWTGVLCLRGRVAALVAGGPGGGGRRCEAGGVGGRALERARGEGAVRAREPGAEEGAARVWSVERRAGG